MQPELRSVFLKYIQIMKCKELDISNSTESQGSIVPEKTERREEMDISQLYLMLIWMFFLRMIKARPYQACH